MLLDQFFVLVSLFDPGVFVFLLALADDTLGFHDVVVDVPLDRFTHLFHVLLSAMLDLLIDFLASGFLLSQAFLLPLVEAVTDYILSF